MALLAKSKMADVLLEADLDSATEVVCWGSGAGSVAGKAKSVDWTEI